MSYVYEPGAIRWKRHTGDRDVRATRPPAGWWRQAMLIDRHPVTGRPFKFSQWWLRDVYEGK